MLAVSSCYAGADKASFVTGGRGGGVCKQEVRIKELLVLLRYRLAFTFFFMEPACQVLDNLKLSKL